MSAPQFYVYVVMHSCPTCETGEDTFRAVFATREAAQGYIDGGERRKGWLVEREIIDQPLQVPGLSDG